MSYNPKTPKLLWAVVTALAVIGGSASVVGTLWVANLWGLL